MPKLVLTVEEAAETERLGRTFVYGLVARCEIPSVKLGRTRRIPFSDLQDFVARQPVEAER
jgi:excisionase family DNA binding protein